MADKTQINLERIRACDAEWEESKHPRSENGQFTSGSGVKVSKATPAMKGGKFNNPKENIKKIGANALKEINKAGSTKQQFEASWKANEAIKKENDKRIAGAAALEKARPKIAAMRELAKAASNNTVVGEEGKKYLKNKAGWGNGPTVPHVASHMLKEIKAGKTLEEAVSATKEFYTDSAGLSPDVAKALQDLQTGVKLKEAKAPAAKPAQAGGSYQQSADKFTKVADNLKRVDSTAAKYARQMSKVAAKSGEAAALKWAENMRAKIEADQDMLPIEKGFLGGRLDIVLKEYNKSAGNPAPQSAPAPTPNPSKKSDVGQKGIDYLRSISHVNSSAEENTGYTARNMIDMINQGKTLKEIRSEMRSNIKKHSPDIDRDLQHLDSIIAKVKRAQQ